MFRNVPGCSGMFHVPDFIDGHKNYPAQMLEVAGDLPRAPAYVRLRH